MISFIVPGEPQGKARARTGFNPRVGKVTSKTPEKTVNYEALIKQIYQYEVNKGKLCEPTNKPVEMSITAFYSIPKKTTKKNLILIQMGGYRPTKKPDADNIAKIVCDALNKIAYNDDTQVVKLTIEKYYADTPRVEVCIKEVS